MGYAQALTQSHCVSHLTFYKTVPPGEKNEIFFSKLLIKIEVLSGIKPGCSERKKVDSFNDMNTTQLAELIIGRLTNW